MCQSISKTNSIKSDSTVKGSTRQIPIDLTPSTVPPHTNTTNKMYQDSPVVLILLPSQDNKPDYIKGSKLVPLLLSYPSPPPRPVHTRERCSVSPPPSNNNNNNSAYSRSRRTRLNFHKMTIVFPPSAGEYCETPRIPRMTVAWKHSVIIST